MAGQTVSAFLLVLLTAILFKTGTALPWFSGAEEESERNARWNHRQSVAYADGDHSGSTPINGKVSDHLRRMFHSIGEQDSQNNEEPADKGLDRDQNRAPAVENVNTSEALNGTADNEEDYEYNYDDYEDEKAEAEVSAMPLPKSSTPDTSQNSQPTERSDNGAAHMMERPQDMASDSTGMDHNYFGGLFRPPWANPEADAGRNPSEDSDTPIEDSFPHRRHRNHNHHHRHHHQEQNQHVQTRGEQSSDGETSSQSPSPVEPRGDADEPNEALSTRHSHHGVPDNISSDSSTPASPEAVQWTDRRTRNRNRPVVKSPDSGQGGKRYFGEGHTTEEVVRMEALREQLMKQLRLSEVPEEVPPLPPLPDSLDVFDDQLDDMGDDDEKDFMAPKTSQVIIFADDVTSLCQFKRSTGCFYFDQHGRLEGAVTGAELWLHKQRDPNDVYQQKLVVSELESAGGAQGTGRLRARNIVQSVVTDVDVGWIKFDVTRTVQRWADKPHKNEGLAVRCKSCRRRNHRLLWGQKEGYRPLLVVHLRPDPPRRQRRSLDCGPGVQSCCRQQFYVTFSELDMPTILRPEGFHANYCSGPCGQLAAHYNHTALIQAVRMRSSVLDEETRRAMTPCCSPTKLRTISLLHVEDGALKTSHVPNLSVVACGCM